MLAIPQAELDRLLARIATLEAQLAARSTELMSMAPKAIDAEGRVSELEAQLAALQPWVEKGKRAVREGWYDAREEGMWHCCPARWQEYQSGKHAPSCDIPALLAQLEADNE